MSNLPPILNAPQVGMLIRTFDGPGVLVCEDLRTGSEQVVIHDPETGESSTWTLMPTDQVKYVNEPDSAWRRVFAEKVEPVRKYRKISQRHDGATESGPSRDTYEEAMAVDHRGSVFVGVGVLERQPDGTWRAVTSEPTLEPRPEGV